MPSIASSSNRDGLRGPSPRNHADRLDRVIGITGPVYAFFGVNPSTADASLDDATVRKWIGFCKRWGASRLIVGNVFAYRATDVRELTKVNDPHGPDIGVHLRDFITEADILVPCWGNTTKVPHPYSNFSSMR